MSKPQLPNHMLLRVANSLCSTNATRVVPKRIKRADIKLREKLVVGGYLLIEEGKAKIGRLTDSLDKPLDNLPINLRTGRIVTEEYDYEVDSTTLAFLRIITGWKEPKFERERTLSQQALK